VDAPSERAEELGYLLVELGASGVEVRDETTLAKGPGPGRVQLVASFGDEEEARRAQAELSEQEPELGSSLGETVGDSWRDAYKEHFKPFALTPTLTVVPPWVDYGRRGDEVLMWMDPGRAFGTGLHATTALVALEIERHRDRLAGAIVLDVGTGSGILAIAALLLGAAAAVAVDNDPEVIDVARSNAERNGLGARLRVSTTPVAAIEGRFPFVVANIRADVLGEMAGELGRLVAPGGVLVLSGILAGEREQVLGRYLEGGLFTHLGGGQRGDGGDAWIALTLARARG
jgi:ribosomal protein L11 methyltransferase